MNRKSSVREPEPLEQVDRTYVLWRGRKLSYFSGCDYYRLASHPRVLQAVRRALAGHGLNVAASRLTTGNHALYHELEAELARFFAAPSAIVLPSGYLAGLTVAQALAGAFSHALLDARAHPALQDAAMFLACPAVRFTHRDPAALKGALRMLGKKARPILLTDGLFAHDGSAAPLREYLDLLPANGMILVDDAHGAGVLGKRGRGTLEHSAVGRDRVIQTITLSKAFGVYGGAILGSSALRADILRHSRLFAGNTPLPLPLIAAALESLRLFQADPNRLEQLRRNHASARRALAAAGLPLADNPGPIIAVTPGTNREIARLKRSLLTRGIFPPLIHYPGAPARGFFRFAISSEHSREQLDCLANAIRFWLPSSASPTNIPFHAKSIQPPTISQSNLPRRPERPHGLFPGLGRRRPQRAK
jgi:7-keto-8-aminopelargonate synthetase-like enzyme